MTQEVPAGQPSAQPPPDWPYGDDPPPYASQGVEGERQEGLDGGRAAPPPPPPPRPGGTASSGSSTPSRAWYFLGVGLIVLAVVSMIVFIVLAVLDGVTVFRDSTQLSVPGQAQVDLPAGERRMLYTRPGAEPHCTATDLSGRPIPLEPSTSVSISINDDEWVSVATFATGDGHVLMTCDGAPGVVRIGKVFGGLGFVAKILAAVFTPILLGFAGAAVLGITGVRHYRSRRTSG